MRKIILILFGVVLLALLSNTASIAQPAFSATSRDGVLWGRFFVFGSECIDCQGNVKTDSGSYAPYSASIRIGKFGLNKGTIINTPANHNAIITPLQGMIAFDTTTKFFYGYNGTNWVRFDSTWAGGGGIDSTTAGLWLSESSNVISVDTSAAAAYLLRRKDSSIYLTPYDASQTYQPIGSYLTSYTETDPLSPHLADSTVDYVTPTQMNSQGFLTAVPDIDAVLTAGNVSTIFPQLRGVNFTNGATVYATLLRAPNTAGGPKTIDLPNLSGTVCLLDDLADTASDLRDYVDASISSYIPAIPTWDQTLTANNNSTHNAITTGYIEAAQFNWKTAGGTSATTSLASTNRADTIPDVSGQFIVAPNAIVPGANGGTGVANTGKTITVSGNTTIGSSTNTVAFATTGNTSVTLPTSGTLAKTTDYTLAAVTANGATTSTAITLNNTHLSIVDGLSLTTQTLQANSGAGANTTITLPPSTGTLVTTSSLSSYQLSTGFTHVTATGSTNNSTTNVTLTSLPTTGTSMRLEVSYVGKGPSNTYGAGVIWVLIKNISGTLSTVVAPADVVPIISDFAGTASASITYSGTTIRISFTSDAPSGAISWTANAKYVIN